MVLHNVCKAKELLSSSSNFSSAAFFLLRFVCSETIKTMSEEEVSEVKRNTPATVKAIMRPIFKVV